jgi:hypothetical protein
MRFPVMRTRNPPNYPQLNFSHPTEREKTQTKQGLVTINTFLVKELIYLVTLKLNALKNKIAKHPPITRRRS